MINLAEKLLSFDVKVLRVTGRVEIFSDEGAGILTRPIRAFKYFSLSRRITLVTDSSFLLGSRAKPRGP